MLVSLALFAASTGCGESVQTTALSGKVTVAGAPLPGGSVQFFDQHGGRPVHAAVDANGAYRAEVPPGEYSVAIVGSVALPAGWKEGDPLPPASIDVPPIYAHPKRSPLSVTVVAGGEMKQDFELE